MKKILIITLPLFILLSCTQNWVINKANNSDSWSLEIEQNDLANFQETKTVSDIEKRLSKLKEIEVSNTDLKMLDYTINSIYISSIRNKAQEKNDINICSKLNGNDQYSCKKSVLVKAWDIEKCSLLTDTWSINTCKNEIISNKAQINLDEKICENIIDESELKFEVNSCRIMALTNKAIKSLDSKMCNKISNELEKNMCIERVKIEKATQIEQ